ncbi:DUF485 domain-containing protein [Streptomyces anandii]|uniref:DUF485 domain-containing protein n=1 Tax=Streptomyces anandii TaxID=285454 RepID=UPI0036F6227C
MRRNTLPGEQDESLSRHSDARTAALLQLQDNDALLRLRAARRRPVFLMVGVIFLFYVLEVILANEAVGFMALSLAGPLNVGLALSLLQCVTTACAIQWHVRRARRVLDPDAARVRALLRDRRQA